MDQDPGKFGSLIYDGWTKQQLAAYRAKEYPCCDSCPYFQDTGEKDDLDAAGNLGECHRYPPVPVVIVTEIDSRTISPRWRFPDVSWWAICGEHPDYAERVRQRRADADASAQEPL